MAKNTLFNYFTKVSSPKVDIESPRNETITSETETPKSKRKSVGQKLKEINTTPVTPRTPAIKRKRILDFESDDDSGDEYKPDEEKEEESSEDESFVVSDEESPPKKRKNINGGSKASRKPKDHEVKKTQTSSVDNDGWPHLKFNFLKEDQIRDLNRLRPTDVNYDPKTLYIPDDFKKNLSPGLRQWWDMKSKYFDCVLFFKVGKFYELYHMDAVIAASELNLIFMRGEFAHVGFPETAYEKYCATLVEKGYKVARVEQTETPDMMTQRRKSTGTKSDKVVRREICQITSRGTKTSALLVGSSCNAESNSFLTSIVEQDMMGNEGDKHSIGICFVDVSIGLFRIGQFNDDKYASKLRTLLAHYPPAQILHEKHNLSSSLSSLLNTTFSSVIKEQLQPNSEMWTASKTIQHLHESNYFKNSDNKLPHQLVQFLTGNNNENLDNTINMTVEKGQELAVKALGGLIWFLTRCKLDYQLLSMGQFNVISNPLIGSDDRSIKHMILDSITLRNLDILENSHSTTEGTLLNKLDNCCTQFGKRLLHQWICNPLADLIEIKKRQNAIQFLKQQPNCLTQQIRAILSNIPDLQRLLSKIHGQSNKGIEPQHPDTRAIMFEEKKYSKRKIQDFVAVINGFHELQKISKLFKDVEEKSTLIIECCANKENGGNFPELDENLTYFQKAFDHNEALKEGRIIPSEGMDPEYDQVMENLKEIEMELQKYLKKQCAYFGCKVTYIGCDKKRYQLEVPDGAAKKATNGYELQSQRKGFKRYTTFETKNFLERMIATEDEKINVLKNLRERIFGRFCEKLEEWNAAVECVSILDVLISLTGYVHNENNVTCTPIIFDHCQNELISLKNGRYACCDNETFIPNDTIIECGDDKESLILVTGPNMGGKSTLMRQLAIIVIMAQIGCDVPAEEFKMTIIDRIFTRLGARDDIMAGESTFYLELCETSTILKHATKKSLVIIDELGRGTSTYDGTAIASSVLNELCRIGCRTMFSTHYHSLVEDVRNNPKVALGHMACKVENDDVASEETVTFLYKFMEGACPKSYGFNAARLAGMPKNITIIGQERARQFELDAKRRKCFKQLFNNQFININKLSITV